MMDVDDAVVVARVRNGDVEAFRVLVERYHAVVFRLAFRMTGNPQDAEDVVQEAFLHAHQRLKRFEPRASFGTWLYRIAANCALDLLRQRQREAAHRAWTDADSTERCDDLPAHTPAPDGEAVNADVQQQVEAALEQLTPLERAAFTLRHLEGKPLAEIGETLGVRSNAVKQSVFRAVHKVRKVLEPLRNPIR